MENDTKTDASGAADLGKRASFGSASDASAGHPSEPARPSAGPSATDSSASSASSSAVGLPKAEAPDAAKGHLGLPVAEPFQGFAAPLPKERTGVFKELVTDDSDIAGLVAYSIYKQNKLDWLSAFEAAKGRSPSEEELASYIIGEGTPRRIATYRHLAEATLAGNGPRPGGAAAGPRPGLRRVSPILGDKPAVIATYAVIALVFLIGFLLAAHYTMSSR